jgi:uncharacterized protein (DUF983 family)
MEPLPARIRPQVGTVLRRGIRGRCPRCGEGPLFRRWIETFDRCSSCNLLLQRNYGDIWMFTILMDRVPIAFGIVVLFFGFRVTTFTTGVIFATLLAIPMLATMRHRQGLALALDYLWRARINDPSDQVT